MIDWRNLLSAIDVQYVTGGKNVANGNLNIACPFCEATADKDPSAHLGILENGTLWGCLRNSEHRGRNPYKLILQLTGSAARTKELLRVFATPDYRGTFADVPRTDTPMSLPTGVKPLDSENAECAPFLRYLTRRNIPLVVAMQYDAHYATYGDYAHRICIPARDYRGVLTGMTARAIYDADIKSLTCRQDGCVPKTAILYGEQLLSRACSVVLVEGAFDAMAVMRMNRGYNLVPLAVGTNSLHRDRVARLHMLNGIFKFANVAVLFDRDSERHGMTAARDLMPLVAKFVSLPEGVDDPADVVSERDALSLIHDCVY